MLHLMEVEFLGGGRGVNSNNPVKPNSVEVVLRLSWGCDKKTATTEQNSLSIKTIGCDLIVINLVFIEKP